MAINCNVSFNTKHQQRNAYISGKNSCVMFNTLLNKTKILLTYIKKTL